MPNVNRFLPLNAFISLCTPDDGWPSPLAEAGYEIVGIETPMGGKGGRGRATPDATAFRQSAQAILLAEAKSGRSVDPEQARRYVELTPEEAVSGAKIAIRWTDKLSKDVVYLCIRDNEQKIITGLQKAGADLPVLSVTEFAVHRAGGEFADDRLNEEFGAPMTAKRSVPTYLVLDSQSSDDEFDEIVAGNLMARLSRPRARVSVLELAKAIHGLLDLLGEGERNRIVRKISGSADRVATNLGFYFLPGPTRAEDAVVFEDRPEQAHPRGRTQKYQALARQANGTDDSSIIESQARLTDNIDSGQIRRNRIVNSGEVGSEISKE